MVASFSLPLPRTDASWGQLRRDIYQRDNGICWACGEWVDPSEYDLGHLIDRMYGGHDIPQNLAVMHRICNQVKPGTPTLARAKAWRDKDRGAYGPAYRTLRQLVREQPVFPFVLLGQYRVDPAWVLRASMEELWEALDWMVLLNAVQRGWASLPRLRKLYQTANVDTICTNLFNSALSALGELYADQRVPALTTWCTDHTPTLAEQTAVLLSHPSGQATFRRLLAVLEDIARNEGES